MQTSYCSTEPAKYASIPGLRNELEERVTILRRSSLFQGMDGTQLMQLAEIARSKVFRRGETLFRQGEPVRSLLMLRGGCVKLSVTNLSGAEVIVGLCGASEAVDVGIHAGPRTHSVSAEAVNPCRVLSWSSIVVEDMFRRMPSLSGNIRVILSKQLSELQERYSELSSDKVERRVACAIVRLARQFGRTGTDGVEVFFSREELAQMTGTTLFTVSRLLSRWKELELLVPRREAVLINNLERFSQLTGTEDSAASRVPKGPARATPMDLTGTRQSVPLSTLAM